MGIRYINREICRSNGDDIESFYRNAVVYSSWYE